MLAELRDPETHILHGTVAVSAAAAGIGRRLVRTGYYPQAGQSAGGYSADWETVNTAATYIIDLPEHVQLAC